MYNNLSDIPNKCNSGVFMKCSISLLLHLCSDLASPYFSNRLNRISVKGTKYSLWFQELTKYQVSLKAETETGE